MVFGELNPPYYEFSQFSKKYVKKNVPQLVRKVVAGLC